MDEKELINNKTFLDILREKLSRGNKKSIHLNVLPGRSATRIDITELDLISKDFTSRFINHLLTRKNFKIELKFDENIDLNQLDDKIAKSLIKTIRRLKSICKQNNDYYLEHGIKPFGFGYPIIYKRDKNDINSIIKAPLIIWSLEIEEDRKHINKWIIKREEDYPIIFNDLLISHIEKDEGIKIPRLEKEDSRDFIIDNDKLVEITNSFLSQFGIESSNDLVNQKFLNVIPAETYNSKEEIMNQMPLLSNSGILGLYISQKQSIIEDFNLLIESPEEKNEEELINENFKINPFSVVETDPTQQKVLNRLSINKKIIIHGPPGTGKSQTLTAIITNALANHAKCLIVCEKRTALEVIYNNLKNENLDKLIALIEDTSKDRRGIIDKARDTIDNTHKSFYRYTPFPFEENDFNKTLQNTKELINFLLNFHKDVSQNIFDKDNWTSFVGKCLRVNKKADWKKLKDVIKDNGFKFSYEEYENLLTIVGKIGYYINNYNPISNPLSILNYDYLKTIDIISVEDEIVSEINKNNNTAKELKEKFEETINSYNDELIKDCKLFYDRISAKIDIIKKLSSKYLNNLFFEQNQYYTNILILILSIFNEKLRESYNDKKLFKQTYIEIFQLTNSKNYFEYSIEYPKESYTNKDLKLNILKFEENLNKWYKDINNVLKIKRRKFSFSEYYNFESLSSIIKNIEQSYNEFSKGINNSKIIKHHKNEDITILGIIAYLDNIIKKNQELFDSLRNLNDFISWNKFKDNLCNNHQKFIELLLNIEQIKYNELFQSWYLNKTLSKYYKGDSIEIETTILKIKENIDKLKSENKQKILTYWQDRRIKSIYRFKENNNIEAKQLFQKTNRNGNKMTLRQIIKQDFELFTDIFPIILVNPSVCSSLFPLKQDIFDIVLFDEASQLRLEDTFCALIRGKHKIISGDEHQMPPSSYFQATDFNLDTDNIDDNIDIEEPKTQLQKDAIINLANKDSLLDYAKDLNYHDANLEIHYRSRHPFLIDFSNAAFYGKRLNPLPNRIDYKPIRFLHVNGIYYDQINNIEAKQVIDILKNNIFEKDDGTYPSVGVTTFNIHQRNLIIDEIIKETNTNEVFSKKIEKLYEYGLFIKNLENIQGDERDIMILSTTFGKNQDGIFSERFGPLNIVNKGHRLFNVIITRAKSKIYICTSFPMENINRYKEHIQNAGNIGKGILYAYLAYANAIENNDIETINTIYNLLSEKCVTTIQTDNESLWGAESPFEQEVVDYLITFGIPKGRIKLQHKCGGFRIDIVIVSKYTNKPLIAIECDGASYHSSNEAYLWDIFRQKQLEEFGFKFIRIWSQNWWINPKRETEKLISFINKIDAEDNLFNVYAESDRNILDSKLNIISVQIKEVKPLSKIIVKNLKTNKLLKLQLTEKQQLNFTHADFQPIFNKTPIANALIGKSIGDICQVELTGEMYEIVDVL